MAVSVEASGTQTATVNTEHTLHTSTKAKIFVLMADTGLMQNGDELELRITTVVLSGGTVRLAYLASYAHVQAEPIKLSIPVPTTGNGNTAFTLKQTAGTGRAFPWGVLSV